MRTRTVVKSVAKLTPQEYRKCYSLNLRWGGYMQEELMFARRGQRNKASAVMIFDENERLIAWSLVYEKSEGQMVAHYYTRRTCRRQGFGDKLMKQVQRIAPKPTVVPGEDIMSQRFFSKHQDNLTFGNVYALYGG
ncbi:acetyltransferase [Streptomyces phage Bmoc]|uniref:Acetyltransferase n=1 Tax=Streptomyces phage Bmoc TaxID=2725629 RepID=A0A6M3TAS7_9CAUD|nr:acetyltransferase [Streptomyces phage Bmoc]QJD50904.1 acetyltransferase [Streptomyces phage Bmoc]